MSFLYEPGSLLKKPIWKRILDATPDRVIRDTGLSREKVEDVFKIIHDYHENNWD